MSTTSCPRCSGQVTLPVGVSNSAKVRCPLCRAHYSLADALVNMPPLLEVVEVGAEGAPADWFAAPPAEDVGRDSEASTVDSLHFDQSSTDAGDALTLDDETAAPVEFAAEEASDDDLVQGSDTEVEELSFSTFDSVTPDVVPKTEPVASLGQDDDVAAFELDTPSAPPAVGDEELALDFGGSGLSSEDREAETVLFGEPQPLAASDDLDFGTDASNQTTTGAGATIDFSPPQNVAGSPADDEVQFDFDGPQSATPDAETIEFSADDGISFEPELEDQPVDRNEPALSEFGDLRFNPAGEADDIPLDVPDEPAAAPVAADVAQEAVTGKKTGKKKKEKTVQASGNGKPKRSLVGTLARVAMSLVIAVPMAAYVALWISPGLDYLGMGSILPKVILPAGFNKYKNSQIAQTANRPAMPFDAIAGAAAIQSDAQPSPDAAPPSPEAGQPADEPPALGPDLTTPAADAAAASPTDAPTEAAEKMPDKDAAAPAAENPFDDTKAPEAPAAKAAAPPADPFAADEAPEKMPAKSDAAAPAAEDPFAEPKSPETPAVEPVPEAPPAAATKPAADDSFAEPKAPKAPPAAATKPAADDPFAPAPDGPSDKPAADTPAEPSAPVEALPEPDQPAVAELGPRNAPAVSGPDVMGALQATQAAAQQMMAAEAANDPAQLSKARANFYVTLFSMANAITLGQRGPAGAQLNPQLQAMEPMFRQQLSADPKRLESLKVFGARWFAFPKRTNNGVVVAGTVESIGQVGKLFHAKIKPGQAATTAVTVVCAKDPKIAAGDEVLTLGSIVEKPADELAGYEGSEPAVVWSGMTMKLSPEN